MKATGIVGTGAAGAGALYYGAKKYADYSYKADKLRAARAASAPAPTAELSAPARTPRVKARAGSIPRMLTAPPPAINPLSVDRW